MAITLDYARAEPQTIRRGFEWRYDMTLRYIDSNGDKTVRATTGYTLTTILRLSESKDGATSGITPTTTVVSASAGTFYSAVSVADSANLTSGKTYYFMVYVNHATDTDGKDVLYRQGIVRVPA